VLQRRHEEVARGPRFGDALAAWALGQRRRTARRGAPGLILTRRHANA
jgi:hypothetical protein